MPDNKAEEEFKALWKDSGEMQVLCTENIAKWWYFQGRTDELTRIAEWLNPDAPRKTELPECGGSV